MAESLEPKNEPGRGREEDRKEKDGFLNVVVVRRERGKGKSDAHKETECDN